LKLHNSPGKYRKKYLDKLSLTSLSGTYYFIFGFLNINQEVFAGDIEGYDTFSGSYPLLW
jgi:hypothetical protein